MHISQALRSVRRFASVPHIRRRVAQVAALLGAAAALQVAAAVGLAYVAGFSEIAHALGRFDAPWIAAVAGSLAISFVGYYISVPWAVIPVPGTAAAFLLAERYRARLRGRPGWREKLAVFLDSIHLIRELILRPRRHGLAVAGMLLSRPRGPARPRASPRCVTVTPDDGSLISPRDAKDVKDLTLWLAGMA